MISQPWPHRLALAAACVLGFSHHASALTAEYCSDINTSSNSGNSSIYQSNGLCYNFCAGSYAFAILQGGDCWCSDYAPAATTTGCTQSCPGYPSDLCGGDSVYGYFALFRDPSGTLAAGPTSSTTDPSQSITTSSSSTRTTTPAQTSSTWTPTAVVSLQTVTGQVRTVTVTPTNPPSPQTSSPSPVSSASKSSSGLGTGGAVGLTVGLVALVALVVLAIIFCYRRRQRKHAEAYDDVNTPERRASGAGLAAAEKPGRAMSENSRYVLGTDGRQVVETWEAGDAPGSRRSRLMPVDPRLDPFAPVYKRGAESNKSRESINTIRDDHDYSRRVVHQGPILRATNPDD